MFINQIIKLAKFIDTHFLLDHTHSKLNMVQEEEFHLVGDKKNRESKCNRSLLYI